MNRVEETTLESVIIVTCRVLVVVEVVAAALIVVNARLMRIVPSLLCYKGAVPLLDIIFQFNESRLKVDANTKDLRVLDKFT